jgi:polyhydroxybutyrate depolymerase
MTFNGNARSYVVAKPRTYDPKRSYPLVLVFHGNPGDAMGMAQGFPFDAASGQDAVLVYPQAGSADGNAFSWDLYTPTDTNVDMNFIKPLIEEVKSSKATIDASKVYGFGYSGGGFFISQYACRFGGVFRAISINAGGGPDEEQMGFPKRDNGCFICPGGKVPTLVTHGGADPEVPTDSGEFTATCYASTNGCSDTRTPTAPAPCELYDGCDKPVKRCIIPGLGHAPWEHSRDEAWSFFNAAP